MLKNMPKIITKESLKEETIWNSIKDELSTEPGFVNDIENLTIENDNFRKVIYTSEYSQLVVMSLKPGEDIGEEIHGLDQFFRIEEGTGEIIIDKIDYKLKPGSGIVVPAGAKHNIKNNSTSDLKLYSIYSPPNHKEGTVHKTKRDAINSKEKFDGTVTKY